MFGNRHLPLSNVQFPTSGHPRERIDAGLGLSGNTSANQEKQYTRHTSFIHSHYSPKARLKMIIRTSIGQDRFRRGVRRAFVLNRPIPVDDIEKRQRPSCFLIFQLPTLAQHFPHTPEHAHASRIYPGCGRPWLQRHRARRGL